MQKILTVCMGNICRSPVAAGLLQSALPGHVVTSAGLTAVVGSDIDPKARAAAEAQGATLSPHQARQFTKEIGEENDLILVLETSHKRQIERLAPQLSGRTLLLGHWTGGNDIPDPYKRSDEFHQIVFTLLNDATSAWAKRLS